MYVNIDCVELGKDAETGEWAEVHTQPYEKVFLAKVGGGLACRAAGVHAQEDPHFALGASEQASLSQHATSAPFQPPILPNRSPSCCAHRSAHWLTIRMRRSPTWGSAPTTRWGWGA